ncbi:MAG TPA: CAP domain-containing protein [Gemmatimonadota bacterium]|nr:CAP domain-containing protein [Gemmatimonadota bacterium]
MKPKRAILRHPGLTGAIAAGVLACATPAGDGPPPGAGPTLTPIRDRYASARLELLAAINRDRHAAGVGSVDLDSVATVAAQAHAVAMVAGRFFGHYGVLGEAPYERLAAVGETGHVQENVYRWQVKSMASVGGVDPWPSFDPQAAHRSLMASSGHRETIVDPHRTHVGLGIAADSAGGVVYVVEEFVARHAEIEPPRLAWQESVTPLAGRMLDPALRPLLVLLRRDPAGAASGGGPRSGPYRDGHGEGQIVPPWTIGWRPALLAFELDLGPVLREPGRWYGVVYVAPRQVVERALAAGAVNTGQGWPGAAFLVDVY